VCVCIKLVAFYKSRLYLGQKKRGKEKEKGDSKFSRILIMKATNVIDTIELP
jgi:hypothetical protein